MVKSASKKWAVRNFHVCLFALSLENARKMTFYPIILCQFEELYYLCTPQTEQKEKYEFIQNNSQGRIECISS